MQDNIIRYDIGFVHSRLLPADPITPPSSALVTRHFLIVIKQTSRGLT